MRTKQASSSNWIGEPRLSSHPRLRFFDMAPRQMQETDNAKFTSTLSPRHRFHVKFHLLKAQFTHGRTRHTRGCITDPRVLCKIPANAPRILSRATSRGFGTKPQLSLCGSRGARKEKKWDPKKVPVALLLRDLELWSCAQRNAGSPFLSSTSRFCFPRLSHGQSGGVPDRARHNLRLYPPATSYCPLHWSTEELL